MDLSIRFKSAEILSGLLMDLPLAKSFPFQEMPGDHEETLNGP